MVTLGEPAHLQDLAGAGVREREHLPGESASGHERDQAVVVQLIGRQGRDPLAIAEHGDSLGHGEDLVELVADEEDRDPVRLKVAHDRQ